MNWLELSEQFALHLESDPKCKGKRTQGGNVVRGHCPRPAHADDRSSFAYFIQTAGYSCSCGKGKGSSLMDELGWKHEGFDWHNAAPVHIATYDYEDEAGELLYQVLRYCPKTFKQRRADGEGGFIWDLKGVTPTLYKLPELMGLKDGSRVLIVDGEKDVETAYKLGIAATCCSGSMDQWKDSYAAFFKGKLVTIIADKDEKGPEQAKRVQESLKAVDVKANIVQMPGPMPPIKDLSDWAATGEKLEALLPIIEGGNWRKTLHAEPIRAVDLAPYIDQPVPYIVDPILIRGCLTQIQGAPKGGKSSFAVYLSLCAATGTWPYPDLIQAPLAENPKVLYITWEDPKLMMAKKLSLYAAGLSYERTFLPENLTFIFAPDIFVDQTSHADALQDCIKELGADIVFIDTLSFVHLCDENSASEMKVPMRQLGELASKCNISICYIHHAAKGGGMNGKATVDKSRGSSAIAAAWHVLVDWGMREEGSNINPVKVESKYGHEHVAWNVDYVVQKDEQNKVVGVQWQIAHQVPKEGDEKKLGRVDKNKIKVMETLTRIFPSHHAGPTVKDVQEHCGLPIGVKTIKRYLDEEVEAGKLTCKPGPHNTFHYIPPFGGI